MNINDLQTFIAVAENASFSRAAEQLFLTQPAVSKRIAALEHDLGNRLFDRIGREAQLTEAGRALLARAQAILQEIEDTRRQLVNLSGKIGGRLALGVSKHVGLHRLPAALAAFHRQHPGVELDLRFLASEAACAAVEQGNLELAVVTLPPPHPQLERIKVWDDPLEIVVARGHPLAGTDPVSLEALLAVPALLPGPGTWTRELTLAALGRARERIRVAQSANDLEVLRMLAAIGFGWAALPRTLIDEHLKVVHIEKIAIGRELGIVIHRARTLSNAARAMIAAIKQP